MPEYPPEMVLSGSIGREIIRRGHMPYVLKHGFTFDPTVFVPQEYLEDLARRRDKPQLYIHEAKDSTLVTVDHMDSLYTTELTTDERRQIMRFFADHPGQSFQAKDLAQHTGLPIRNVSRSLFEVRRHVERFHGDGTVFEKQRNSNATSYVLQATVFRGRHRAIA